MAGPQPPDRCRCSYASRDRPPAQSPDHPHRFTNDSFGRLALALGAVHEDYRDLHDAKMSAPGPKAHLDLKRVAIGPDIVEVDGLQDAATEALEASRGIPERQSRDSSRVYVRTVAQQQTRY